LSTIWIRASPCRLRAATAWERRPATASASGDDAARPKSVTVLNWAAQVVDFARHHLSRLQFAVPSAVDGAEVRPDVLADFGAHQQAPALLVVPTFHRGSGHLTIVAQLPLRRRSRRGCGFRRLRTTRTTRSLGISWRGRSAAGRAMESDHRTTTPRQDGRFGRANVEVPASLQPTSDEGRAGRE
jgi:hypothetical protein